MIYTVFVSIADYLANGGVLVDGHELYVANIQHGYQLIGWYDINAAHDLPNGMITITQSNRSFPFANNIVYVRVKAIPVYEPINAA